MQDHNKRVFRRGLHGSLHHRRFRLEQGRASEESRTGRSLAEAIRLTSSLDSISDVIVLSSHSRAGSRSDVVTCKDGCGKSDSGHDIVPNCCELCSPHYVTIERAQCVTTRPLGACNVISCARLPMAMRSRVGLLRDCSLICCSNSRVLMSIESH